MVEGIRQKQKRQTRVLLLEAALRCFARDGLSSALTAQIATEAGLSHGALFVHFPTREALLAAAIEEFGDRVTRRLHELAEGGEGVRALLRAHLLGLAEHERFYARLVTEEGALPDEAKSTMVMIQSAISFHLSTAVEREIVAGTMRRMPFSLFFNTWIGLLHYYLAHAASFVAPGESLLERRGPELLEHYLALISTQKRGAY